ncbi:MAG TPA: signal recognition particle-docking protein FtsY, partial [Methylovirgula sp.]
MSEPKEKSKGLFGRLFKGGAASPDAAVPQKADVDVAASEVAQTPFAEPVKQEPVRQGWFQRLRSGLGKTSSKLASGITDLFS